MPLASSVDLCRSRSRIQVLLTRQQPLCAAPDGAATALPPPYVVRGGFRLAAKVRRNFSTFGATTIMQ